MTTMAIPMPPSTIPLPAPTGGLVGIVKNAFSGLINSGQSLAGTIGGYVSNIPQYLSNIPTYLSNIPTYLQNAYQGIAGTVNGALGGIGSTVTGAVAGAGTAIDGFVSGLPVLGPLYTGVQGALGGLGALGGILSSALPFVLGAGALYLGYRGIKGLMNRRQSVYNPAPVLQPAI